MLGGAKIWDFGGGAATRGSRSVEDDSLIFKLQYAKSMVAVSIHAARECKQTKDSNKKVKII